MNHQIKRATMALLLSVFCFVAYAQKSVTGTVKDATGEPMIGVSILVDGTTIGAVTDFDGNFTIKDVPENGVLKISYIGYKDQKIAVAGKSSFNVTMQEDAAALDEIVVTVLENRQLDRYDVDAELLVDCLHCFFKACIVAVHLIDDHHACLVLFFAHGKRLFRADCRTGNCADHDQCRVAKRHRSRDFAVEVEEARSVDQIDLGVLPFQRSKRHVDGNGTLDFFGIEVSCRRIVRKTIHETRIVKHGLRQSRFAFAAVSEDTDVANFVCGVEFHLCSPCWNLVF